MFGHAIDVSILVLLILINGVLAMSELALVSARRSRLEQQARAGSVRATAALQVREQPTRFLSTVQVGITLVGILAGAFGGARIAEPVSAWLAEVPVVGAYSSVLSVLLVVLVITYLTLVAGELVPKRLAMQHPETIAKNVARPMQLLSAGMAPVVALLSVSTEAVLRMLRVQATDTHEVTEDDVKHLIHEGTRAGIFEPTERDMVVRIFRLSDRDVGSLMTPRHLLTYLDVDEPDEVALGKVAQHQYTYFPVCRHDLDHVLGVVRVKALWPRAIDGGPLELLRVMEPAQYVPENMPVLALTELFRSSGNMKALVIDEHGVMQGLVTMTDVLEAIVGDLDRGILADEPPIVQRDDGSWLLDGMLPIDDVTGLLGRDVFPLGEREYYDTLSGFLMVRMGHVPAVAESITWHGWRFEVVDMDGLRVDKVLVTAMDATA